MKKVIKALVNRTPFIKNLREQIRKQGAFPAGHYYSPIPSNEDVVAYVKSRKPPSSELLGINLNKEGQHALLSEYVHFYDDIPFSEQKTSSCRYYYKNSMFGYSDAIFLYSFLRKHKPKRIIEVGSGFSSAVMLDTIDSCFSEKPEMTFIEPYPERLISLFREKDKEQVRLIDRKVQDVSPDLFLALKSGDLLFIDSSHVMKCGSDLQFLMFEILPRLQSGVFVHFHDVFYPFDYLSEFLMDRIYWNEAYFLRAFLFYNSEWSIRFFNSYVNFMLGELIKEKMPLCAKDHGGSLYIQRA
jgi:predicted O-methyltransferase YrrM